MTAAQVNAQSEPVRRYIHDLETRCDPTGEVQKIYALQQQVEYLTQRIQREKRSELVTLTAAVLTGYCANPLVLKDWEGLSQRAVQAAVFTAEKALKELNQ